MQFVISFPCDGQPTIFFEDHPNTWTHKREAAKRFDSVQEAASFSKIWRLTDGVRFERIERA